MVSCSYEYNGAIRFPLAPKIICRLRRSQFAAQHIDLLIELSYTLNASTDYLLLGRNPDRDQDRKQLLQVISQLSDIARNM